MESKPTITCAGDEKFFSSIKNIITDGLPRESEEWTRSHMRNPKNVYLTAQFAPYSEERLPPPGTKCLLGQAFFHIYWAECQDLDHYRQSVKENISNWLATLKARKIYDWLIVVIDHSENKKSNKTKLLSRGSVLDKVKSDFPSQGSQRCISLLDPCRNDSRAVGSMQCLLQRIRKLVLQAYSRQLCLFEEHMRTQRERRNENGWSFQNFFFLQEELALVLEMLGLYDEALIQYDELDALFTQFVINSNVGDMPEWLTCFSRPCDIWSGVCLLREKSIELRNVLLSGNACLLDLRNYLFSRQCALLLLLCRPWEVAQRTLPFLHNCISELKILEVNMPPGAVACWVFLSCFEVLQTCEKFSDTSQIKEYSLYCAGLWAYAREKLHHIGILCGLMPDLMDSSEKLHIVVNLLAGMGADPYPVGVDSPHAKLRAALSSKESFLKHYLELSELTMGTFKHNRRIRTARLIGKDLAQLYMKMKQPQKAVSFLTDLLKTYREENWEILTASIQEDLLECYSAMEDIQRYLKTCIRLAATLCFNLDKRKDYFQEIISCSEKLGSDPLLVRTERTFLVSGAKIESSFTPMICDSEILVTFHIHSNLPSEIICRNIKLFLKKQSAPNVDKSKQTDNHYLSSKPNVSSHSPLSPMQSGGGLGIPSRDEMQQRILVQPQLIVGCYRQEGAQIYSVMCKNTHQVLRRRDSQGFHKDDISEEDNGPCFKVSMAKLVPGPNVITITVKVSQSGVYVFHRLWMEWGNIHFALSNISPLFSFLVMEELPTITRKIVELTEAQMQRLKGRSQAQIRAWREDHHGDLVAGIEQDVVLKLFSGSYSFSKDTTLTLKASRGLRLKNDSSEASWEEDIQIKLPEMKPFSSAEMSIKVIAQVQLQKTDNAIEHFITILCPWSPNAQRISLQFLPPFFIFQKLNTCGIRKYIEIVTHGVSLLHRFLLNNIKLELADQKDVALQQFGVSDTLIIEADVSASFLWEIMTEDPNQLPSHFIFSLDYQLIDDYIPQDWLHFSYEFRLNHYQTLYAVRARIEPPPGSEFCRAGNMCFLHISINQVNDSDVTTLMYEVVADQAVWAVCGRTAGVVNIDNSKKHGVTLDVKPLISGFLPLPTVRLSKYIPAEPRKPTSKDSTPSKDSGSYNSSNVARLEPFDTGQVYNWSRAKQIDVLPASSCLSLDVSS
ncbi:trafficking protein particle complex subunit 10-like [Argiope bruennichi]|uniref:trafficking protein particle complex subunit 10-like n=1 Tax=Argiope bruennichi TaxID=94029 RepID=UPI002494D461|nr:trafficking protein particle complex subunit 10-like [Argiope bruennichi]